MKAVPAWPRQLLLCRDHTTAHYKTKRREETGATLYAYGDITRRIEQARAHFVTLRAECLTPLACTPQHATAELLLSALAARSEHYLREFADQAWRVFPNYRDRQRTRGNETRAAQREAHSVPVDLPWLRRVYRDRCVYCGTASEHIDHLWPLVAGGDDAPWNLVPACADCNLRKGGKPLADWLAAELKPLEDNDPEVIAQWRTWTS
ncbi:HNH endonuclease [Allokutzneria sp. A3M-2-11 16]|uniref:HNH endonuclease n=1 Tax=Allokutzneria sp. A3M-2-11 16 TaxID=2962043 RepID=UPI0020B88412|nr:HNH endonuclease signature motif containing protein [Allokutzneria sp. A3M-2-11 16]MCP3800214.1 HNH endonuclease [Allokutzneria sp. A3M-2-11 16]